MRAVDTNGLVRLIARDDRGQALAADRCIEKGAWVSILALAEAIWVLGSVYETEPADLDKAVEMLLNHNELGLEGADAVAGALDLFRSPPSLGFSDCLMLPLARTARHVPLSTFARNLGKQQDAERL